MTKEYLGDGVYIKVSDNTEFLLTTENGIEETNVIFLEYEVLQKFLDYINRWKIEQSIK